MALIARISSKGQATIPKRARQALGLKPGDLHLTELEADGSLRLRKVAPSDLSANPLSCQHGSPSSDPADP
uniref:AbrB/MazE/SpoVT family DNA-binding domain-containing protein n=1 Tax=Thermus islandicus TaxID=540988 RepID=A0A7C2FUK7_9DEIN